MNAPNFIKDPPVEGKLTLNTMVNVGLVIVLVNTALNVGSYKEKVEYQQRQLDMTRQEVAELKAGQIKQGQDLVKNQSEITQILTGIARIENWIKDQNSGTITNVGVRRR